MISLIALLGQFFGLLLAKLTKEELKPGKKYFSILRVVFLISILVFLFLKGFNVFYFLGGLLVGLIIRKEYFYFGLISNNPVSASLIFIYGLPYGTLNKDLMKLIYNSGFFIVALIINFIYPMNLSLSLGGLTTILLKNAVFNRHWIK